MSISYLQNSKIQRKSSDTLQMPRCCRIMRSKRYRWAGWFYGLPYVNAIVLSAIFSLICFLATIQKLQEAYSTFFASKVDKESFVTSTKMRTDSMTHLLPLVTKSFSTLRIPNPATKTTMSRRKTVDMKDDSPLAIPSPIFFPAIKVFYKPHASIYQRNGKINKDSRTKVLPLKKTLREIYLKDTLRLRDSAVPYKPKMTFNASENVQIGIYSHLSKGKSCQKTDEWTRINSQQDRQKVLVYSAYWDDRFDKASIRVMAIMPTKNSPAVYCRIPNPDGTQAEVTATKKAMNEHWRLPYASYFVSCDFTKDRSPPNNVSLSCDQKHEYATVLPVRFNKQDNLSPRGGFAVCVKPLHYHYDRATWLMEFIEFHRLLGTEHFFFYNHTVGPNVDVVLRSYQSQGVVSILPWQLNIRSQKEIRTEGIFSSLNDCLFRTMYLFRYVIMLDFDEYIVPREHDTYPKMINHLEKENKRIRGRTGSFVFRNTFFYLYWENDTTVYGREPEKPPDFIPYFITQYKTRRLSSSMKPGSRSKYIVVPDRAIEVGNHVVWRHTSGSRAINVPDAVALLHHYRICEFGGYSCLKKNSVVDHVALKFGPALLDRVRHQCQLVFGKEDKCPLSPPLGSPW